MAFPYETWRVLAEATPLFCPGCWEDVAPAAERCAHCGQHVRPTWRGKDSTDRLIAALLHPDANVSTRAAWLLGHLRDGRAVRPLIDLTTASHEPLVARSAIRAFGELGGIDAEQCLNELVRAGGRLTRCEAIAALEAIEHRNGPSPATRRS